MLILLTGGTGYIGSHICLALLEAGHNVVIVDNLSNSTYDVVDKIELISHKKVKFYEVDVSNELALEELFIIHHFDALIHLAAYKAVAESVEKPLEYYHNNLLGTIVLAKLCLKYKVYKFIYSSSATVYGVNTVPYKESMPYGNTSNPYGSTKAMCERILIDTANVNPLFKLSILRYFNPIGAHSSGLIGDKPSGTPNNLMPYITQVALGKRAKLYVYGNDYPTSDGSGVRDYIHVLDLAEGHLKALENIRVPYQIYNLGTGFGTSVLSLITTFEKVNSVKIPYEIAPRRSGDIAECYSDPTKALSELKWKCRYTIEDMCRDAYRFELNSK